MYFNAIKVMGLSKNQSFLFDKNEQWQVMSCPATKQMSSVSHEQSKQKWQVAVSMTDVIDNMAIGNGSSSPGKPVTFVSTYLVSTMCFGKRKEKL